ncbi:cytochrome c [Marivirga sp. S37H4]|uniref:Cytochrome c n=2 Tax=Marivirga aurantiaca TaxID=2802615 RepID=A0A934WV93_9BACT|nr:cytochrome c [Marivirga aurantiaca]
MHQPLVFRLLLIFIVLILNACGTSTEFDNQATEGYSNAEKQKFAKYMIQGKSLYTTYCSNCHQTDGEGLGKLYPPLAQSDYMLADKERTICLIKKGLTGEIEVNGISYEQAMPGLKNLSNLEIAEITTYVYNSWGHETGFVRVEEVEKALRNCE